MLHTFLEAIVESARENLPECTVARGALYRVFMFDNGTDLQIDVTDWTDAGSLVVSIDYDGLEDGEQVQMIVSISEAAKVIDRALQCMEDCDACND